ncbi:1-deoxy-D-xylulose-5-phosphate synthase [Halothiobacillus diazotrophicus]|uniref:1-deoxy-D-xylulose-5-phosphate synthase n=1 Tax=Halothiobacillus diazotrophicus TaxID=1860122 RepID=A0A191ZGG8_9GAMM|nr:1-deoxy-D-xylulose-5-phosphate synthase [Halothiobacillus diazotrophicus]ANJ66950.1 1-deoxy-D-xylulose-5-phosphate synthase [Halothiobacillus diazotrophicus]
MSPRIPDSTDADLLSLIELPADLRRLPKRQLAQLANELRTQLIESVAKTGGHLAANLGVIELTIALHYVFDTPNDRLIWDVGHQAYGHKMLTGRRAAMTRLRMRDGPSGFTRRSESAFDAFGAGHSSTSISAALGMAVAAGLQHESRRSVAIIGDGALTAGQAFEALNHAGELQSDLLVVLNDNEMSISRNVGALTEHLTRLRSNPMINKLRQGGHTLLAHGGPLGELLNTTRVGLRDGVKHLLGVTSLFEELGFQYFGPIDGHDLGTLVDTLQNLREQTGPRLLHVVTQKGRGFNAAERDPVRYHGVGRFDPKIEPQPAASGPSAKTWTNAFSQWLADQDDNEKLVVITPAMIEGSGLAEFGRRHPDRCFDVGIAEQHAVTFAGGLAAEGLRPLVAIYSTFLQRAWDQVIHDIALQNLPVLFAVDRAGLVGPDGATHAGSFDLAFGQAIPNLMLAVPADERELRTALDLGTELDAPVLVRYPRGDCPADLGGEPPTTPFGLRVRRAAETPADSLLVVALGTKVATALNASENLPVTMVDLRWAKPIDWAALAPLIENHAGWMIVEEGSKLGGIGATLIATATERGLFKPVMHLALPDVFIEHGTRNECLADGGLDVGSLNSRMCDFLRRILPARQPCNATP